MLMMQDQRTRTPSPLHGRRLRVLWSGLALLVTSLPLIAAAGPFDDPGHPPASMVSWATEVDTVVRGPQDIADPAAGEASFGIPENVLGEATTDSGDTLSLGDGGQVTVYLESGIVNGPGDDFAVFENGFFDVFGLFAELAYVEVGTNGVDFARFEVETANAFPVPGFEVLDPTDYDGLAGRHAAGLGTGFDLADLHAEPQVRSGAVDLTQVHYVRVIDIIGDGSTVDAVGAPLYDPYPTPFPVGGFDLDAVGALHVPVPLPEPARSAGLMTGGLMMAVSTRRRRRTARRAGPRVTLLALLGLIGASPATALTATFEDLGLGSERIENGAGLTGDGFVSDGIFFENTYFASFDGFSGFAASTTTDTTTAGFTNQYSNITGGGAGGSDAFGIFFPDGRVVLPSQRVIAGAEFVNTTYAALSMRDGDQFAKQFGGPTGDDPDLFQLFVEGFDDAGISTGELEIVLADYRFADNDLDFILDEWTWVDLTGLGSVRELAFRFESTDLGDFGINTPQYFAIDNLTTIPEPGSALLLGLGLTGLALRRRDAR